MRQKSVHPESPSERIVKNIRRVTRKRHSECKKLIQVNKYERRRHGTHAKEHGRAASSYCRAMPDLRHIDGRRFRKLHPFDSRSPTATCIWCGIANAARHRQPVQKRQSIVVIAPPSRIILWQFSQPSIVARPA
jgi:hypothetical protein